MNLERCEKGHFYDKEKYTECPHCSNNLQYEDEMSKMLFKADEFETQKVEEDKVEMRMYRYDDEYVLKQKESAHELHTSIYEIELFRSSGQIRRKGIFKAEQESTSVVILGLPYSLRENSINILTETGLGIGSMNVFNYCKEETEEVDSLIEQSMKLSEKLQQLLSDIQICNIKIDGLDKYIAKQIRQTGECTEKIADYESERKRLVQQKIDLENKLKSIKRQKREIKDKKEHLQYNQKRFYGIKAEFIAEPAHEYVFSLDYVVNNVGWKPNYDIYTYSVGNELTAVLKAEIYQNSSEDWENVKLRLTTESDLFNFDMVRLYPENISIAERNVQDEPVPERNFMKGNVQAIQVQTDNDSTTTSTLFIEENDDMVALPKTPEVVQLDNSIQRKYILPEAVNITDGTDVYNITLSDKTWHVNKIYFSIPKNELSEYMGMITDELKNEEWLAGSAKIYIDGTYSTTIDTQKLNRNGILALGRAQGVDLYRDLITDKVIIKKISGQKELHRAYQICAENKMEKTANILIMDQIPVSRNPLVSITNINIGNASVDENGICRWNISIEPNQKVVLPVEYVIVYPAKEEIKWECKN